MRIFVGLVVLVLLVPFCGAAQTLSQDEQEVWDRVVECWASFQIDEDEAASLDCFHEEYSFWWAEDVLPFGKDLVRRSHSVHIGKHKFLIYDLRPAAIVVTGNVAVVQWGVRFWSENPDGTETVSAERVSMTLLKENGVWRYLGGGGSPLAS